jgi:hypothetical protein
MFICKKCNEEISNAKMVGLVIGQVGRETALKKGLSPEAKGDIIAGVVSGFKIKCPSCDSNNWNYQ